MEPGSKIKLESSGTISCLVAYSPQSGERTPAVGKRGLQAGTNTQGWRPGAHQAQPWT